MEVSISKIQVQMTSNGIPVYQAYLASEAGALVSAVVVSVPGRIIAAYFALPNHGESGLRIRLESLNGRGK